MLEDAGRVAASPLLDGLVSGSAVKSASGVATRFAPLTLDRRPGDQMLGWSSGRPRRVVASPDLLHVENKSYDLGRHHPVRQTRRTTYPPRIEQSCRRCMGTLVCTPPPSQRV